MSSFSVTSPPDPMAPLFNLFGHGPHLTLALHAEFGADLTVLYLRKRLNPNRLVSAETTR